MTIYELIKKLTQYQADTQIMIVGPVNDINGDYHPAALISVYGETIMEG